MAGLWPRWADPHHHRHSGGGDIPGGANLRLTFVQWAGVGDIDRFRSDPVHCDGGSHVERNHTVCRFVGPARGRTGLFQSRRCFHGSAHDHLQLFTPHTARTIDLGDDAAGILRHWCRFPLQPAPITSLRLDARRPQAEPCGRRIGVVATALKRDKAGSPGHALNRPHRMERTIPERGNVDAVEACCGVRATR